MPFAGEVGGLVGALPSDLTATSVVVSDQNAEMSYLLLGAHHRPKVGAKDLQSLLRVTTGNLLAHLVPKCAELLVALCAALPQAEDRDSGGLTTKQLLCAVQCHKVSVLQLYEMSISPERLR